jgi:hypothetical protein
MGISDGMILFAACAVSFAFGYVVGVVRLGRYVSKELTKVHASIEAHKRQLELFYSRLSEEDPNQKLK